MSEITTTKQTLERILNALEHAHGEGVVYARVDRGNNGLTTRIDMVWLRGEVVQLGAGIINEPTDAHVTIPITADEYSTLNSIFAVPDFNGYSFQKSERYELSELITYYKRLVLDELITEL